MFLKRKLKIPSNIYICYVLYSIFYFFQAAIIRNCRFFEKYFGVFCYVSVTK